MTHNGLSGRFLLTFPYVVFNGSFFVEAPFLAAIVFIKPLSIQPPNRYGAQNGLILVEVIQVTEQQFGDRSTGG
jgi:hypothetical protein